MMIKFQDLNPPGEIHDEIQAAITATLDSGRYLFGPQSEAFARKFSEYLGGNLIGIPVGCGFDALVACMTAFGIGRFNTVLVPLNAPLPVWMAVTAAGATPYPIPFAPDYSIDMQSLEYIVKRREYDAIIVVHLYGRPVNVPLVRSTVGDDMRIVEDCAQAHGAKLPVGKVGTFGDMSAFSFYPTKNLGGFGDSGMVMTADEELAKHVQKVSFYGGGAYVGMNSRMDELQAAVLNVKLPHLDRFNAQRKVLANTYLTRLESVKRLTLPEEHPGHIWHQFIVRTPLRDQLQRHLADKGIETMIHYPQFPLQMPVYSWMLKSGNFASEFSDVSQLSREILSLPISPHLSLDEIHYICDAIKEDKWQSES